MENSSLNFNESENQSSPDDGQMFFPFAVDNSSPKTAPVPSAQSLTADPIAAFIEDVFTEAAHRWILPQSIRIRVKFKPYRSTLYTWQPPDSYDHLTSGKSLEPVRLHLAFRSAPEDVLREMADLIFCPSKRKAGKLPRAAYDEFVESLPKEVFNLPGARKEAPTSIGEEQGKHRSLRESFDRVNKKYFQDALECPDLRWSPVRARSTLGSYQEQSDRLIVSQVFDSPRVPLYVLDFLMYHELLHKFLGIGVHPSGKRIYHNDMFRKLEKQYDRFEEAGKFLERL